MLSILWIAPAQAQGGGWSEPYRLSSDAGKASQATLVADQYGYVHCFWTETLFADQRMMLQYSRFDGGTWTAPNDIYLSDNGIESVSSVVDKHGILHVVWTESSSGPVYYTYAPAFDALSAQNWAEPLRIGIPAGILRFQVDSKGVLHIVYVNRTEEGLGVYYVRSEDQGQTWSEPLWLDPDILPAHTPDSLNFQLDENDGLHAAWFYGALERGAQADWVRYIHSLDGGETWSSPFLIDRYVEESDHNLTVASPIMIVEGQTVHVIWAAGEQPYRNHRYSADAGRTWSAPAQIFGDLHGQAFDGFTQDGAGRVYFFGQIRYPFGIYEAYWDQAQWSLPSLVYLIAQDGSEDVGFGDRVHAHHTHPVVRAGNQLVLTFGDGPADPNRRLFAMHRTLNDIPPLESMPTPVPASSPAPEQPTPIPEWTPTMPSLGSAEAQPVGPLPGPNVAIRMAVIPTLLILGGTLIFQLLNRRRR